jgi:hypothetical protein
MSWDDGHARDHEGADTAQDIAGALKSKLISVLAASGHGACDLLADAQYRPDSGAVICGCGQFAPWSDDPASPPWEATREENDAVYRGMQAAADQREALESNTMGLPAPGQPRGGALAYEPADPIRSTLALIDPTEVYGPEDVERHILDVLYRLETGALMERETIQVAYRTAQAFDTKYNAYVAANTGGAADVRKASAMVHCQHENDAMIDAKMLKEAVKQTMHNLRAVLSGYQSTARSVGSTYQAGGSQGAPPKRDGSPW